MANQFHLVNGHTNGLRRHLQKHRVCTLPYVCSGLAHNDFFDFRTTVQLNGRPVFFGCAKAKANIFESHRHSNAPPLAGIRRLFDWLAYPGTIAPFPIATLQRAIGQDAVKRDAWR